MASPGLRSRPAGPLVGPDVGASPSALPDRGPWWGRTGVFAFFAALAWFTYYSHSGDFGLYEDDYFFISPGMGQSVQFLQDRLVVFQRWSQGRPIGFYLPDLFSFIGDHLGGLHAIYLLGFGVVLLNVLLFYALVRSQNSARMALLAAIGFCLFPADTTKLYLTHAFQLQPSLTFFLLAALLYVHGHKPWAYVVIFGSLLSYESGFVVFFGAPLLVHGWNRRTVIDLLRNAALLIGVLLLGVVIRLVAGESRAESTTTGFLSDVPLIVGSLLMGPFRAVAAFFYGPLKYIRAWTPETVAVVLVVALATGAVVWWLTHRDRLRLLRSSDARPRAWMLPLPGGRRVRVPWSDREEVGLAGLVMLLCAYLLAFTHYPPVALVGRGTSVHLGATVGAGLLFAYVASIVLDWAGRSRWSVPATVATAAYVGIMAGYGVTIQHDFVRSWAIQKDFWQQVAACCSDAGENTILLYLGSGDPPTTFIFTNSWADPLVLTQTYDYPAAWENPPRLFTLSPDWISRVEPDPSGSGLRWWIPGASWDEHWEPFPSGNVIILQPGPDGRVQRVTDPITLAGQTFQPKPAPPTAAAVTPPPGPLYPYLLGSP